MQRILHPVTAPPCDPGGGRYDHSNFENIRYQADGGTRHIVLADTLTNIGTGILERSRIVAPASSGALLTPMMFPVLEEYANWFMPKSGDVTFQAEETVGFLDNTLRLTIGVTASKTQGGRVSRKILKPLEFHYIPGAGFRQTRGPALQERLMETYGTFWPGAFKAPPLVNLPPPKPAP